MIENLIFVLIGANLPRLALLFTLLNNLETNTQLLLNIGPKGEGNYEIY